MNSTNEVGSRSTAGGDARVLITGASGFIGSATTSSLAAAGVDVVATSRFRPDRTASEALAVDATSLAAMTECIERHRPTHLIMLAWPTDVGTRDQALFEPWLENTVPVMRAFAANGGERFIGVGTCMEYDWSSQLPLSEDSPLGPGTEYGRSKASAYELVAEEAISSGLSWGWARPFFLYGPREPQRRLIPDVVTSLLRGEEVRCTEGLQYRDFLHVDDVAAALGTFALSELQGPLNIGSGASIQIRELVSIFAERMGGESLVRFGARELQGYEVPEVVADTTKLRTELGFRPATQMTLGVDKTIDWWRQELQRTGQI